MSANHPGPPPPQGPTPGGGLGLPPRQPHSQLAIAALVVALVAFIGGLVPFVGFAGAVAVILGIVDLTRPDPPGKAQRHTLSPVGIVFGSLAFLGGIVWVVIAFTVSQAMSKASCPHVYAYDGASYRLDGDMVSGALYVGAEREDLDRLESLKAKDGEYRLRIADELEETDHVDDLTLLYVDHVAGVEVLPTQTNEVVPVRDAAPAIKAVDAHGEDVLARVAKEDGAMVTGAMPASGEAGDPRVTWTLDFPRPTTPRALLIVRGHVTPFAEEALGNYLATMGQGVRPALEWAQPKPCACFRAYLDEEMVRMGLPLTVEVSAGDGFTAAPSLAPVGPAILRSQALAIDLPAGTGPVSIRLGATPLFWEIDQVELAPFAEPLTPASIAPRAAVRVAGANVGEDVTALVAERDGHHLDLVNGDQVEVRYPAPPLAEGQERTVIASMRGYYAMNIGGKRGMNPSTILAHRLGLATLPRFARELAARPR